MIETTVDLLREQSRLMLLAYLLRQEPETLFRFLSTMAKDESMRMAARALLLDIQKVRQAEGPKTLPKKWGKLLQGLEGSEQKGK